MYWNTGSRLHYVHTNVDECICSGMYNVHTINILEHLCAYIVHALYILVHTYIVCTSIINCSKKCLIHRWTAEELRKVIAMLRNPEFDAKDISKLGGTN
jgi:hypothetical protein